MIDVAAGDVVGTSFYTYDTMGRQVWAIGAGSVNGNVFEIDFYITDGGIYGSDFNMDLVNRYLWGKGVFTFSSCHAGRVDIIPHEDFAGEFESLTTFISRSTTPVSCGDE